MRCRLKSWAGLGDESVRRLTTRLAIVVVLPVVAGERQNVNDLRAFMSCATAGELGVALGVLHRNDSDVGDARAYVVAVPEAQPSSQGLGVYPANVHLALDRELAAAVAGAAVPDRSRVVLVGAGSLGSQMALKLAREGAFAWTVVDYEHLLPHNLARHALFPEDIGSPKADALARKLGDLLDEPVPAVRCDVLGRHQDEGERLATAFAEAAVIIDASASVAVSRYLSDIEAVKARRVCAFFNPAGTSVVVLAENAQRDINLRDLEAQYYRVVGSDPRLSEHLDTAGQGVRYSGSCRALTNRIPASNAAMLAALAARGTSIALATDEASIRIWILHADGRVELVRREGATVIRKRLGEWTIAYDTGLLGELAALRAARLPRETGGVLLGVADMSRGEIYIAGALPEAKDSCGTETGFERGIVDLQQQVNRAVAKTMHQVRYVGEWHSHPDRAPALPSSTDMAQLAWLGEELESEGLPGLIAIAAQDGCFTVGLNAMHGIRSAGDAAQ